MEVDYFSFTNRGGRDYNEDAVGCRTLGENGIFVVADGLGGHEKGDVASSCVMETLISLYEDRESGDAIPWLVDALGQANTAILNLQNENHCVMKSTAVALIIDSGKAVWAHVGDSRLYYFHENALSAVTPDHSVAYKKYAAGEISRWGIGRDEDQSSLLRSLGGQERNEPELCAAPAELAPGDAFLLCSDGVWEYLHDDEVVVDRLKAADAKDWGERLLLRVMDRVDGTNDNLSLLTVIVRERGR